MAIVYLLHFLESPNGHHRHLLGVAEGEHEIPREALPYGRGTQPAPPNQVADVWDMPTPEAAEALAVKFRKQGSRRRLCSICNPGNARGSGTGNWTRKRGEE